MTVEIRTLLNVINIKKYCHKSIGRKTAVLVLASATLRCQSIAIGK